MQEKTVQEKSDSFAREGFFDIDNTLLEVRGNAFVKYKTCLKVYESKVYPTPRASCQIYTFQFLL